MVSKIFRYLYERKKWWLLPIIIILLIVALLIIFVNSPVMPFIYTLF